MQFMGYSFDSAWEKFLQILPKYMNSHYYDIMAYCCGLVGFIVAMLLKQRIKNLNRQCVQSKYNYDILKHDTIEYKPMLVYKIRNLIVPILAAIVSIGCFEVVAFLSDRIKLKTVWLWIIPFIPIAVYAIYELFESGLLGWIFALLVMDIIFKKNYDYCCEFEDHHKICYAVRVLFVVFGILGIIRQFMPSMKINRLIAQKKKERKKAEKNKDISAQIEE